MRALWLGERARRLAVLVVAMAVALALAGPASAFIYLATGSTTVARANLDGTGVDSSFVAGGSTTEGVAVDGSHVYWANHGSGTIGRANLDGSGVDQSFISGGTGVLGVAVDGSHVYWANDGSGTIGRANLDGSGVEQSFITGADGPHGIAVDGSHVYWTNINTGTIGRANLDGSGADQSFIASGTNTEEVAVDSSYVYWTTSAGTNTIGRANLDGSGVDQSFIAGGRNTEGVAVDSSYVYWTTSTNTNRIGRANLDGSGVEQSFISLYAYALAVDVALPGAPTGVSASSGDGQATVSWSAPASNGGKTITSYTATSSPDGKTCSGSRTGCTVSGLRNGVSYTFTVTATTGAGTGPASGASGSVTPTAPVSAPTTGPPGAPTGVSASAGDGQATVSWSGPASDGGATIRRYTVTGSGGQGCSWSTGPPRCTVTGLTDGVSYTFTVTATNSAGTGPASAASAAVTPVGHAASAPACSTSHETGSMSGNLTCGAVVTADGAQGRAGAASVTVPPDDLGRAVIRLTGVAATEAGDVPIASDSAIVRLTVTSRPSGGPITSFTHPLRLHFPASTKGTPAFSRDGSSWTLIPRLATPALPAGQADGYYVNADRSTDIYTRHATYFAFLHPAAPTGLTARLRHATLTLRWRAGRDGGATVGYAVLLDGMAIATTHGTAVQVRDFVPHGTSRYRIAALAATGATQALSRTVTVRFVPRPRGLPRRIPHWAWRLIAWQQRKPATRGARPHAPARAPAWYWAWRKWRLDPRSLQTS